MRRFGYFVVCIVLTICAIACREEKSFDGGLTRKYDVPCMLVVGTVKHKYAEDAWQELYSPTQMLFRIGDDTMSEYFQVELSVVPSRVGQSLTGSLEWTSDSDVRGYKDLSWTVEDITDAGLIWLWNSQHKIAVALRVIE